VSTFYEVERELTQLGIGEAMVTALNPKGVPMPTVRTLMRPPMSLMAQLDPAAFAAAVAASEIAPKYATDADPASAADALAAPPADTPQPMPDGEAPSTAPTGGAKRSTRAPERDRGIDWGKVAEEGARFSRSGTFNTILRSIIRVFTGRR
jgi:hypothetical protein